MRNSLLLLILELGVISRSAQAAAVSDDVIRIGLIIDMSGVYANYDGPAGLDAIRLAIKGAVGVL